MSTKTVEYTYYGNRAPENHDAMLIAEVDCHMIMFWWTGYVRGNAVKLYPRKFGARYYDEQKRKPFVMPLKDLVFK